MSSRWRYVKNRFFKVQRRWRVNVCRRLYWDGKKDLDRCIIVAGTSRSGHTWLADVIGSQLPSRKMFEPFYCERIPGFRQFHYYQYMRPDEVDDTLYAFCQKVFTGRIRHEWIDQSVDRLYFKFRLLHENRGNLFLRWIHNMFPEIPLLLLVRHPCAVVLSRLEHGWAPDSDIESFLSQGKLMNDFLSDRKGIIESADTDEEKHAIIWCVHHLVPIQQFQDTDLNTIFYENLCVQPELEIDKVFRILKQQYRPSVFRYLDIPSITAQRVSAVWTGGDKISRWRNQLSSEQIHRILSIVKAFDLDYIYSDSVTPIVGTL